MKKFDLFAPWLIVCTAMVFSLFFSQVQHEEPCTLCWYQRMSIFPLVIILGIAAFRNAYRIVLYVLPVTLIGLIISIFHVTMVAFFAENNLCPSCTLQTISNGVSKPISITFPALSLGTFIILNALLIGIYYRHNKAKKL
ncbi:MAG: disulfide bond formation protein B [Verrucomicrobia bacterium]|nr:disulfide bond formation protein B [Verrucomicrobiota bacterium]